LKGHLAILTAALLCLGASKADAGFLHPELEQWMRKAAVDEYIHVVIRPVGSLSGTVLKREIAAAHRTRALQHTAMVVRLREVADLRQKDILATLAGAEYQGRVRNAKGFWIDNVITAELTASAIAEIASRADVEDVLLLPSVELVSPVGEPVVATLEQTAEAMGAPTPGLRAIKAPAVWAMGYTGKGRLIASLDTGVDGAHVLLGPKWRGHNGGKVEESWFNPQSQDTIPRIFPGTGANHGTWVTGIMVALQDTNLPYAPAGDTLGVCFDADWISAAVIDIDGANIFEALQWVADPDGDPNTEWDVPDVVNNSWGIEAAREGCSDVFWNAIDHVEAAGAAMVFAAGNEGYLGAETIRNPANRITSETNSFSVGMIDAGLAGYPVNGYSSSGPSDCDHATIKPEVAAPGVNIKTTHPGNNIVLGGILGTSFATPHVAGAIALLREYNPNATVDQIKEALLETCVDLGPAGPDNAYGHGLIDIPAAMAALPPNTEPYLYIKRDYYLRPAPGSSTQMTIVLRSSGTAVYDVSVTVFAEDDRLEVTNETAAFGDFPDIGDTAGNFGSPFVLAVEPSVLEGERLPLRFEITGDNGYARTVKGALQVGPAREPGLVAHDAGNFGVAVSAVGTFGHQPGSINPRVGGVGFVHGGDPTQSLFEGAFLVATGPGRVSDNARSDFGSPDVDFRAEAGGNITLIEPGPQYAEETRAAFSDAVAETPIGVFVEQRTMADDDPALDDALMLEYVIHNRTAEAIENLYAGLFFDWDFPWPAASSESGGFDADAQVGWMNELGGSRFRGLTVLTPQGVAAYRYFQNDPTIYGGFSDVEKWTAMTGGFLHTSPQSSTDGSNLISTGPYIIAPGDSVLAAFALIGAASLGELLGTAANVRALYSTLCSCPSQGDLNTDGPIDGVDLAYLIDIVFFGSADRQSPFCPTTAGDFDGNRMVNAVDLALIIDRIHFAGNEPADPCTSQ